MSLRKLGPALVFLAGAIIGGLALAFLVVFFRPELLVRAPRPAANATPTPAALRPGAATLAPATTETAALNASAVEEPHSLAAAVRRAAPAVVNIYTARVFTEQVQPNAIEQFFGHFGPRLQQHEQRALGSGVIIDEAGHIVTNNHVIANATTIKVQLADGRTDEARVVGRDPDTDLALLSIKLRPLPVMSLGRSDQLQVGDAVLAIGNPLGLQQTVTHGIVSAINRKQVGVATFENFIQTDAPINGGNSGGALVNIRGELVGINTANLHSAGAEGIGFAIPVNLARGVISQILDHGRVVRGWSGIVAEDFSDERAAQYSLPHGGIVVTNLYANGPAVAAGVRPGDILLAIDGREPSRAQEAFAQLASRKPGTTVTLRLQRGQQQLEVVCRITEPPSQT